LITHEWTIIEGGIHGLPMPNYRDGFGPNSYYSCMNEQLPREVSMDHPHILTNYRNAQILLFMDEWTIIEGDLHWLPMPNYLDGFDANSFFHTIEVGTKLSANNRGCTPAGERKERKICTFTSFSNFNNGNTWIYHLAN
jgi:hypothetical protein